jgi:hypothetical protein
VWQADLDSGHSAPLARGLPALAYDISADGRQVVLETEDHEGKPRLWLMSFGTAVGAPAGCKCRGAATQIRPHR